VSLGVYILTFPRIAVPSTFGSSSAALTQRHIPKDLNLQQRRCETLKASKLQTSCLCLQERQALVQVLHIVKPRLSVVRFPKFLARDDLQQLQQLFAIREIGEEVLNLHPHLRNKSPFAPISGMPMLATNCLLEQLSQHTCHSKFREDSPNGLLHKNATH